MRSLPQVRRLLVSVTVAVALFACSSIVQPTAEHVAKMSAQAIDLACGRDCERLHIYVVTDIEGKGAGALPAETQMSDETKEAIERAVPEAQFVSADEAASLLGDDSLIDGGRGMIINVGAVEDLGEGLVGVEVILTSAVGAREESVQEFEWDGEDWRPVEGQLGQDDREHTDDESDRDADREP